MKRLFLLLLAASVAAQTAGTSPADFASGVRHIQLEDIRAKMYFLSNSNMAGRLIGTPQHEIAADYIAAQFMELGLQPAEKDKSYFQNFDMVSAWPEEPNGTTLTATIGGQQKTFQPGYDYERWWVQSVNNQSVQGPVEFLGYGTNAPEYSYNDFAGANLRGKVAMVLAREPGADDPKAKFRGTWDTYHAYDWFKVEQIRAAGAAAVLIVQPTLHFKETRVPSAPPNYTFPSANYGMADGLWDLPVFLITPETANFLLSASGKTIAELQKQIDENSKPNSFDVPGVSVKLEKNYKSQHLFQGRNVAALLEGSDPELKKQYVVVSGHYDHMGIVSSRLYAGADDDASGVVGTLEIAQAFVRGGIKPKRSILFICFDAEEEGLFGSWYYITHPLVPLADTAANLNMDMIGRDEESLAWNNKAEQNRNMVNVLGTLYNPELRKMIEQQNQQVGLKLDFKQDVHDSAAWFSRSDHFWFATRSIPQVFFNTGEQPDYHTEYDTWDRINYPKMTKIVQLIFLSTAAVADDPQRLHFTP